MTWKAFLNRRRHYRHQRRSFDPARSDEQSEDMPLNEMLTGQTGTIQELRGGRGLVGRLASLGFTPGAYVEMLQNYGHGPLIIEIRDVRIALGRGEARNIRVRLNHSSKVAPEKDAEE